MQKISDDTLWHELLNKVPGFIEIKDNFVTQEKTNRDGKVTISETPFTIQDGRVIIDQKDYQDNQM